MSSISTQPIRHHSRDLLAFDGFRLFSRWHIVESAKAVIVLVHGLGEHSGRYDGVVEHFNQHNLSVVRYDQRGHGHSQGFRGHIKNYDCFLNDLSTVLQEIALHHPHVPIILYGHSMGGGVVANWCMRRLPTSTTAHARVVASVLSAPWFRLRKPVPNWQAFGVRLLAAIWPWFTLPTRFRAHDLCRDPEALRKYAHDRLVHHRITMKLAIDCFDAGRWVLQHAPQYPVPVLAIHGEIDPITCPDSTLEFCHSAPQCTLKMFPGLLHEPHQEPERAEVLQVITQWILQQIERTTTSE